MTRNKPAPVTQGYPMLQWANGKDEGRDPGGRFGPLVGWHIEQGATPELDATCKELGVPTKEIKHRRSSGVEIKPHWWIGEEARIFPLSPGPVADTMRGAARVAQRSADEASLVATWGDDGSYLSLLALVEFAGTIHPDPVRISARSHMTDHLYAALLDHLRICEGADAVVGLTVPPWWLALPLVAGPDLDVGRDQTTTIVPVASAHPAEFKRDYLDRIKLPSDWREYAGGQAAEARQWAMNTLAARLERNQKGAA